MGLVIGGLLGTVTAVLITIGFEINPVGAFFVGFACGGVGTYLGGLIGGDI